MSINYENTHPYSTICFVEGCLNYAIPIVLHSDAPDPFIVCGPCGNPILKENIVLVVL
jgi:hypothetical protein